MFKLPWGKTEHRADSYTEALVALITAGANAGATKAVASAVGALEAASGLVGRAFATAMVEATSTTVLQALTPARLAMVGRALIRNGQCLFVIDMSDGELVLLPVSHHDIFGGPNPRSWEYRASVPGPQQLMTYERLPAESILHFTYAQDVSRPFAGVGPLQAAGLTGRLAAELMSALADESATPRGQLMGYPLDPDDPTFAAFKSGIKNLSGGMAYMEVGDLGGTAGAGVARATRERLGAEPPSALVELFKLTRADIFGACGINPALFDVAPGVAMREAYREFLFSTVAPLGRMVAHEASEKLNTPVTLDWAELRAGDIASHARAFSSMVQGGIPVERAAALSGLLAED